MNPSIQPRSAAVSRQLVALVGSWLLLVVAVPLGMVGAVVAFFGAAYMTSRVLGLILVAILACLLITSGLAWLALGRIIPARRGPVSLSVSAATLLVLVLLSTFTIFQPLVSSSEPTATLPAHARYWDLPTGSRIAYLKIPAVGVASATPIIVLHGGPGAWAVSSEPFTAFFSRFAALGYDVYLYDQIGSGLSARLDDPTAYTVARHVADLEAIRQQIGAKRVILIGESWGSTLAASYMALHPAQVAKVIFESPGPIYYPEWRKTGFSDLTARLSQEQNQQLAQAYDRPRFLVVETLLQINPRAAHAFASDQEMDGFQNAASRSADLGASYVCDQAHLPTGNFVNNWGFYASIITQANAFSSQADPRGSLTSNHTPALILTGECNYIKWEVTYEYKRTLPNATLLYVPGAGHLMYLEQPALFFASVRAFLLDQPLPLKPYTARKPPIGH